MYTCYICGEPIPEIDEFYPYIDIDENGNRIYFCNEKCQSRYYI